MSLLRLANDGQIDCDEVGVVYQSDPLDYSHVQAGSAGATSKETEAPVGVRKARVWMAWCDAGGGGRAMSVEQVIGPKLRRAS